MRTPALRKPPLHRFALAALFVAASLGLLASRAGAATVQVSDPDVNYSAAAGETNTLAVSRAGGEFVFSDVVAITPTAPCVNTSATVARCPASGIERLDIRLSDMGDRAVVDGSVGPLGDLGDEDVFMEGDAGNDQLTGSPNAVNFLFGHEGSSTDAPGADTLTGGSLFDLLSGSDDADLLSGGGGGDVLSGGRGADTIAGGAGTDRVQDFLEVGAPDGPDTIEGGADFDQMSYEGRSGAVAVDPDNVADDGEGCPGPGCEGDNVGADVEGIEGGSANDVLVGNDAHNQISGGDGDDLIDGAGGDDFALFGGRGNDTVNGGPGDEVSIFGFEGTDSLDGGPGDDVIGSTETDDEPDAISGGSGLDLVDYSGASDGVRVDLDGKADDGVEGEGDNVAKSIEDIAGTPFADVLVGSKRDNELIGDAGDDRLAGKAGLDGLVAGRGDDRANGGKGTDLIEGEAGADKLKSRDGRRDQVSCGSDVDKVTADRSDRLTADCDRVKRRG